MKTINIGITGHTGFIGVHLAERAAREPGTKFTAIDDGLLRDVPQLAEKLKACDVVVHLAGMNRGDDKEIFSVNTEIAGNLVRGLETARTKPHLIFASSIQSGLDNAFGRSKKEAGRIFKVWGEKAGAPVSILIIPNVFGDRGRPFYNSVIATFCHQLARGEEPKIMDDREVEFIYINALTDLIVSVIKEEAKTVGDIRVAGQKKIRISSVLKMLEKFKDSFLNRRIVPHFEDEFQADLYNVFLSYLDPRDLRYSPAVRGDGRGALFEIIKLQDGGQIFFSTTRPGVVRGNHYHTRKIERFCVVRGSACIRVRRLGSAETTEFKVDGREPTFVEIPIYCSHQIENTGQDELLTLFWCNELFDPEDADTYTEEVIKG